MDFVLAVFILRFKVFVFDDGSHVLVTKGPTYCECSIDNCETATHELPGNVNEWVFIIFFDSKTSVQFCVSLVCVLLVIVAYAATCPLQALFREVVCSRLSRRQTKNNFILLFCLPFSCV